MGGLQKFEQQARAAMISGAFARAFRSAVQPVEIAAALQRECDNNAQILSRERRLVPNDFHVELSQTDLDRLAPYDTALADELANQLQEHADQQSYVFPGPVTDRVRGGRGPHHRPVPDPQPRAGEGHRQRHPHPGRPRPRACSRSTAPATRCTRPALVVGRGTDADLRINDPGVSRRHIEFEVGQAAAAGDELRHRGARPRLDQRHARRRPPDHPHRPARRLEVQDRQHRR